MISFNEYIEQQYNWFCDKHCSIACLDGNVEEEVMEHLKEVHCEDCFVRTFILYLQGV